MGDYHEPIEQLSSEDRDVVRALHSLREEIDAVDWYQQRTSVCNDEELRQVLDHNRKEEIEHACMVIEWLRRHDPAWDEHLKLYLFNKKPILKIEEDAED